MVFAGFTIIGSKKKNQKIVQGDDMKVLDLFCGLGGWSDGFFKEGFECTGVEINRSIAEKYPYNSICADVAKLNPEDFKGFDVIVGSPPCRNFTAGSDAWWKIKKDPMEGLRLINVFLNFC